jgi:glycosyltransferase involved in cell wall biosynthesis
MRLLMAIPYFTPAYAFGGSVTVAETIVAGFLAAGHEVTVATTDVLDETHRVPAGAPMEPVGAEVMRFPNVSHRLASQAMGFAPRGMRGWLAENLASFDVVLLQDFYSAVSVMSARAAVRAGKPFVLQPHGTLSAAPERGRHLVKRTFMSAWGRTTVETAAALMHSSDHERDDFLAAGATAERLVAMPLPLDLPAETAGGDKSDRPTVAYVGRLHAIKGLDRLIEAVALARRELPDIRLDVTGPGERHQRQLEAQAASLGIRDAVLFRGYAPVEEKLSALRRSHAFALLSRSEGLPMAALEAMACGVPVVLSEGCHLHEVHDVAGLVVDGTPEATARALVELLRDEQRRERFAEGATAFAHEYRREVVMPRMVAEMARIAAGGYPAAARSPA